MHNECGYKFIGDESFYRLTNQEMRVLRAGYNVDQREQKDRQNGVKPGERSKLKRFENRLQNDRESFNKGFQ